MKIQLHCPFGDYQLQRFPLQDNENLRAWDAADEYILDQLHDDGLAGISSVVIFNDAFGALSLALSALKPTVVSDSYLSQESIKENLQHNGMAVKDFQLQDCLSPIDAANGQINLILLKVPKNHSLLEYQLSVIQKISSPSTRIIAAGMAKYINKSMLALFEKTIGPTTTSLARKKARLIFPQYKEQNQASYQPLCYQEEKFNLKLINHANVFSRQKQDIGARFFIEHFPQQHQCQTIIDLGCGNGVLGFVAAKLYPTADVVFCDESYFALQSAREGAAINFDDEQINRHFTYHIDDALSHYKGSKADLILCNPPFHQQHAISDQIALTMFKQAAKQLTEGGHLYVIGNRHLDYHTKLKRHFKQVKLIASDRKFILLRASG